MDIKWEDIITAIQNQRNTSQNENAQLFAMLEAAKREIAALKQLINKKATDGTDRDTVHAGNDREQQGKQNTPH